MAKAHDKEDPNKHIQHVDQTPLLMNIRFLGYKAQNLRGLKKLKQTCLVILLYLTLLLNIDNFLYIIRV
jgi:hypothetical protein